MLALVFLILRLLGIVNTPYDWLILCLLYIGDQVGNVPEKIRELVRGE